MSSNDASRSANRWLWKPGRDKCTQNWGKIRGAKHLARRFTENRRAHNACHFFKLSALLGRLGRRLCFTRALFPNLFQF